MKPPYGILEGKPINNQAAMIFSKLASLVEESGWEGACHITTALLHVAFTEIGLVSTPVLGEAKIGNIVFDHSWAEVDRKPFDVAITLPLSNQGLPPGISPVFSGIDTTTGKPTIVEYGTFSNVGEFAAAEHIRSISFIDYVDQFPGPPDFLTLLRKCIKAIC